MTIQLAKPSFTEAAGTLTLRETPRSALAVGTGTPAVARIKDGNGAVQVSGLTVGTDADGDINLPDVWVLATVTIHDGGIAHG